MTNQDDNAAGTVARVDPGRLVTVGELARRGPFPLGTLRWWLFSRESNGLDAATFKIGRRLYLDLDEFERWVAGQRERSAA